MPESLTPITREETYLAAIAGEEVSVPDPICRKEEFLDAIDTHIGSVEGDVSNVSGAVTALQTQIPASTAGDEGKVLTAGSTAGTASWQTPSGGGGAVVLKFTGECTYDIDNGWECGVDKPAADIEACFSAATASPAFLLLPELSADSPYYDYSSGSNKCLLVERLGGTIIADAFRWGLLEDGGSYIVWVELTAN